MTNDALSSPLTAPPGRWARLDFWLERAGERLNPILVKEARQALKSRQFVITFGLLLVCVLGWSLIGVAILMPGIYYAATGPFMLTGYAIILTVPMLLIVPFSAYRSLAGEREDGTYELLSITTLSSRQIVTGKLGSAVLQMLVYYSALSPCIAFTYLLRGIDIITLGLILFYTFIASVLLSSVGLLVATLSRARHVQVLLSVGLLLGLAFLTLMWCIWTAVLISEARGGIDFEDAELWLVQAAILTGCGSYLVLFVLAAAAQLSFASDNRSTKLRVVMLAQQILFTGWISYFWAVDHWEEFILSLLGYSAVHWMLMGSLLTGEWSVLSPRVKRQLPQSTLGRAFLTWFNPGSGTGYVFAVVNQGVVTLLGCVLALVAAGLGRWPVDAGQVALFGVLLCAYVAVYLGVGRLIVLWLRRFLSFGLLLPLVIQLFLLALGIAVPSFLQAWLFGFSGFEDYSALQAPNWAWTLVEAIDGTLQFDPTVPILVVSSAAVVFLINLVVTAREIEQEREAVPERVILDELQQHPERAVTKKRPANPFEE